MRVRPLGLEFLHRGKCILAQRGELDRVSGFDHFSKRSLDWSGLVRQFGTQDKRINFVGNHAFGDRQLNAVIKTSVASVITLLTGGDAYDPDRVNEDRERCARRV